MMEEGVDTGPGLETQFSWDYHSTSLPSTFHIPNPKAGSHNDLRSDRLLSSSLPDDRHTPQRTTVVAVQTNGTAPQPNGVHRLGRCSDPAQVVSGFHPSSKQPWNWDPETEAGPGPSSNPPSRAETAEEKDVRVRAERRQQRAERAAQVSSLATLSLLLIASTLFVVLAYTGWNAIAAAVALFCASVAGYPFLHLLWYALSSQMFKVWRELSALDRFRWGQKGASLVHSTIMSLVATSVLAQGTWRGSDLMTQRDDRVAAFLGLEIGYLLQDTGMEAYKHFAFGHSSSPMHLLHHTTLLATLPWYYKYLKGDFFLAALFLWSTSTVTLHLRWFQTTAGSDKGLLYQLNSLALLVSFLACRIVIVPLLLCLYASQQGWAMHEIPFRIPPWLTALALAVVIVNYVWMLRLLKDAFKRKPRQRGRNRKSQLSADLKKSS